MHPSHRLLQTLHGINGKGYKAYQETKGAYDFADFSLSIDYVQGDPFAAPSHLSIQIPSSQAGFPSELYANKIRKIALGDFLSRAFQKAIQRTAKGQRGTGHSGLFTIDCGQQEVLERNSLLISADFVEARFGVGLPASGRRILGLEAEQMLFHELPVIVDQALFYKNLPTEQLQQHVQVVEDQEALREQLAEQGLVAFIANGSTLPRRSGIDDRPLREDAGEIVVPFLSPPQLEVELSQPNQGPVRGMGIPRGVTLIVGGGFHGKSTLLRALERGVYNHVAGDGREMAVTIPSAVKIRAEDGRSVEKVDISPFVNNLPYGKKTAPFSTANASGSTSQAANIIEALEVGTKLLLIDEDTSATNFVIRDARMQALVEKKREPITPFVDKVRQLFEDYGTSTILVMGGSGDYFERADLIILLDQYRPSVVTEEAKQIVEVFPTRRKAEGGEKFGELINRYPLAKSFDPSRGKRDVKIDAKGVKKILFGTTEVDLSALEQLVDVSQTRAIGEAIFYYTEHYASKGLSLQEGLQHLMDQLEENGLDMLTPFKTGNLARPRIFEIAFAINRMRSLRVR